MQIKLILMTGIFMVSAPLYAGVDPDLIMQSGFEFDEGCSIFDGFNDRVDIRSVTIRGDLKLNGQFFPLSEYDDALFSLRDRTTGDVFEFANSHDLDYEINVVAGNYDVLYSVQTPGPTVPKNINAVVISNVGLWADQTLNINLTSHMLSGTFQHNGAAFPQSEYDDALIYLDSAVLGTAEVGNTHDQTFSDVVVLAGNYEVRYQLQSPGETVPWNQWGFVGLRNINSNNANLNLNIQSINVSGSLKHNNVAMPASEYDDGLFYMETSSGDRVLLENSHSQSYSKRIILGSYDVFWELQTQGDTVPFNKRARVMSNVNLQTNPHNINMTSVPISGNFTLNGAAFSNSVQQTGQMVLRDLVAEADNVLSLTTAGTYSKKVIAGSYDIVYQHMQGELVPQNKNAVLYKNVSMNSASVININVISKLHIANVYHNGVLFPASADNMGNIIYRNDGSGDYLVLGKTSQQNFSVRIIPGTYDGYYSHLTGSLVPQNKMARFKQNIVVPVPGPSLVEIATILQIDSMQVSGLFNLNDAIPPVSQYDDGLVSLKWEEDSVLLGNTHDGSYLVRLIKNPSWNYFWASYGVQTKGPKMPINNDARLHCVKIVPFIV